jgi:hypothetical protein
VGAPVLTGLIVAVKVTDWLTTEEFAGTDVKPTVVTGWLTVWVNGDAGVEFRFVLPAKFVSPL